MWLLSCPNKNGQSYRLTREKEHDVSRTVGDIILAGDQSVSRKHAVFKFISNAENGDISSVTVTDLESRYGTYINGSIKLDPHEPYLLQHGDVIKFGCQWNEWSFFSKPLVVVTSTLSHELKISIKKVITELGGILVNEWQENCSHLTMTNILLTAKYGTPYPETSKSGGTQKHDIFEDLEHVVCALASAVPIVTPEYWTSLHEALTKKTLLPDHNKFIPPLQENVLNRNKVSFAVNEDRKTIFSGKTFVFSTEKQMKKYKCLISAAGGKSVSLANCGWKEEDFCKPNIILMQHVQNDKQSTDPMRLYNSILKLFKSRGGRPIPESEVGLAVLMCSLNIYCNPHYNVVQNVLQGGSMLNVSQLQNEEILAADTPSVVDDIEGIKMETSPDEKSLAVNELSIPESGSSLDSGSRSKGSNEEETLPVDIAAHNMNAIPSVALAVEQDKPENVPPRKRIASDDLLQPAAKKLSSEKISFTNNLSQALPFLEPFNFIDLLPKKNSNRLGNIDAADSAKRKHDDMYNTIPNEQHSKKKHQETPCCSKQVLQSGMELSENTQKLNDRECQLGKRTKLDGGLNKDLGSRSIPEQGNSSPSSASLSRQIRSDNEEFVSTSKANLSERRKEQVNAMPSTTKGESRAMIPTPDNKMRTNKRNSKVGEKRRIPGMNEIYVTMVVKMEDLIIERPRLPMNDPSPSHHSVNFKKFKKVRSTGHENVLPQIIGDGDLMVYRDNGLPKE